MLHPSTGRLQQLADELLDVLERSRSTVLLKDRDAVRQALVQALSEEVEREVKREETVARRLGAMRRGPRRGSREWEELFHRLVEEEYLREGLDP